MCDEVRGGEKERKGKVRNREGGKVQVGREMRERVKVCKEREKKEEERNGGIGGKENRCEGGVEEIASGDVERWRSEGNCMWRCHSVEV